MFRNLFIIGILISATASTIYAQRDLEKLEIKKDEIKIVKKSPKVRPAAPRGERKAQVRSNGVLFILTDPDSANVTIKNARGASISQGRATAGEFRAELPPGVYNIEVTAAKYSPFTRSGVQVQTAEPEIVEADLNPTAGTIVLGGVEAGSTVLIDDKPPAALNVRVTVKKEDNQIELENVPEGFHTLRVTHPNLVAWERQKVQVVGGATSLITPRFAEAAGELIVATEPGTSVYIDGEFIGETPSDGLLKRSNVRIGQHEIKLVKTGFEEYKERRPIEAGKSARIEHALVPVASSGEFTDDFEINLSNWTKPAAGWALSAGRLDVGAAPKPGFATGYRYRDFYMQFHLKLANGGGAAWAIRMKDTNNYYLFYLSGPQGLFPGRFNTYIVQDNKFDPQTPFRSNPVTIPITAGGQYTIEINVLNNDIYHKIIPSDTGMPENLGYFKDPNNLFPIGLIGFRTVGSERFSIDDLIVSKPQPNR